MDNKYDIAVELYEANNYTEAYRLFYVLAEEGDCESQRNVANMLLHGLGVKKDENAGYKWYKKVADLGDEISQHSIAGCYIHGLYGFKIDFEKAIKYLQKASEQNYLPARHDLAIMLFNGNGIQKDKNKAEELLKKNAKQGYGKSIKLLATYYVKGKFGILNVFKCFKYIKQMSRF